MAIVSYTSETRPKRDENDWAEFDALKDEDIDYSEIPVQDMSKFRPWRELHSQEAVENREQFINENQSTEKKDRPMFKPLKTTITCKLDADVVAWLKSDGKGYQTRLNAILRRVMASAPKRERQAR